MINRLYRVDFDEFKQMDDERQERILNLLYDLNDVNHEIIEVLKTIMAYRGIIDPSEKPPKERRY